MQVAGKGRRIEYCLEEIGEFRPTAYDVIACRSLHPGIGHDDPKSGQGRFYNA